MRLTLPKFRSTRLVMTLLGLLLAAELGVIAWHYLRAMPARAGIRVAQSAERGLGAGPLDPKRYRIDYTRIDQRLRRLMERSDLAGLGIAVIEDGQLSFIKGYGTTSRGPDGTPVTPRTVFRWASCSKGVAATLVALLAERRRLSLDDPVAKWVPDMKLPKGNEHVATLADMLSHRLGIVKNAYDDRLEGNEDPRAIRTMFAGLYPMCAPGTCFGYQNVGYDGAHEAVERATRESYGKAAHDLLFGPLGMTSASTTREGLMTAPSWARPHNGRRVLPVEEAYYRVPAAGGVNSSIIDMGLWMRAQMGGTPSILTPALLEELHAPRVKTPRRGQADYDRIMEDGTYGLGFRQMIYAGHHLVGHRGAVSGYRSLILFDPVERVGVAMLWNSQSVKPTGMPLEILDMYYRLPERDWLQIERP